MRYLLLIYTPEAPDGIDPSDPAVQEEMAAYGAFTAEIQQAGAMLAGEGLHPTSTATSVRVRDGDTIVADGPFAETKEVLGGFYMVDCPDLEEAIRWAAKIPGARRGTVEVRPIVELSPQ